MAITHATSTGPIGETQWLENHTVDAAALRTALNVADGATANATDAALRDRATHTGTQAASTITGLSTVATTGAYSDLSGKPTIIDWTVDQGATNLHAGNIPDLSATYSVAAHNHSGVYEPADATILKSAAIGTTVQGYDANTAKLNSLNTWTATQSFTTVQGAVATRAATAAETIPLDGRMHILTLADGQATVITGSATTAGQYATLVLIGSPAGTGSITWAAGHVAMNGQVLNPAAGAYTDFALDSPDGTTIRYRGVGVEQ